MRDTPITRLCTNRPKWVEDLITIDRNWDELKLQVCFDQKTTKDILATHIPYSSGPDEVAWIHTLNRQYDVKPGHWDHKEVQEQKSVNFKFWTKFWKKMIWQK